MKAAHGIFKIPHKRKSDCLAVNDLEMTDDDSSVSEHVPLKFCRHWWLENGKILKRFSKVIEMMVKVTKGI